MPDRLDKQMSNNNSSRAYQFITWQNTTTNQEFSHFHENWLWLPSASASFHTGYRKNTQANIWNTGFQYCSNGNLLEMGTIPCSVHTENVSFVFSVLRSSRAAISDFRRMLFWQVFHLYHVQVPRQTLNEFLHKNFDVGSCRYIKTGTSQVGATPKAQKAHFFKKKTGSGLR